MHVSGENRPLGIIMLDTTFARPPGDAGNASSWPFSVRIERVSGAHARQVVDGSYDGLQAFIDAAMKLEQDGAGALITTCGFLVRHQRAFAAATHVPIETSPLMHFGRLQDMAALGRVAILTIHPPALDSTIRQAAGIPDDALIFGPAAGSHFVRAILDADEPLDVERAEAEWVALALAVQRQHPDIAGWLFECANMPPYSQAVSRATGLPVFDTLVMGRELHARTCR